MTWTRSLSWTFITQSVLDSLLEFGFCCCIAVFCKIVSTSCTFAITGRNYDRMSWFRPFFFISKGRTNRKCRKSPPWERVSPWWRLFLFFLRIGSNKSCNEKLLFQRTANNFTRWTIQGAERALSIREICSCFLDAELSQNTAALCGNGCDYFIKIFPGGSTDRDIGL
jgi:hypothetical protein